MTHKAGILFLSMVLATFVGALAAFADDVPPLELIATIPLKGPVGGLDHLSLDAKRSRLFVANTVNGSLDVVDLKAGKLLRQVEGQTRIRGIDYSPDWDRVVVGNGTRGICNVFDGEDYRLLKSLTFGDVADNVCYNPKTRRAYVIHAGSELAVFDADSYEVRDQRFDLSPRFRRNKIIMVRTEKNTSPLLIAASWRIVLVPLG